jgi:hypothetical protein
MRTTKKFRRFFSMCLIFLICWIYSKKKRYTDTNDDFEVYFQNYLNIVDGEYINLLFFEREGFYYELGLPLLHLIFAHLLPVLNYNELIFAHSLTIGLLYLIWVERYSLNKVSEKYHFLLSISCILFLSISTINQLTRQAYAAIFILYALTLNKKLFWIALATSFHLTAPIGYLLLSIFRKAVVSVALVGLVILASLGVIDKSTLIIFDNIFYIRYLSYFYSQDQFETWGLFEGAKVLKMSFILAALGFLILIKPRVAYFFHRPSTQKSELVNLSINIFICGVLFFNLPYANARLFLSYYVFMMGYLLIVFFIELRLTSASIMILLSPLFIYKIFQASVFLNEMGF